MQRRGGSGQPAKQQRKSRPKAREAPTAHVSNADLQEQLGRAMRERDEALERQAATSEVLQVISSSPGKLEPVFRAMLENALRICEAKFGTLFRFDGKAFHRAAGIGVPSGLAELQKKRGPYLPESGTLLDRVLQTREVAHSPDYAAEPIPGNAAKLGGARSTVAVPMLKDSELVGAIIIYRQEVRPFTDKQIELVQNFAAQAVIAIENTRLLSELHQRTNDLSESLEQQTATSEVLKVISSSPGKLEPVFDAMLANATRICEAEIGVLYLGDEDSLHAVAATHDAPPAYVEARKQSGKTFPPDGPIRRAASTKQVAHVTDIRELQSYLERHPMTVVSVELGKFRTVLAVPMLKDDELIGVITLNRQEVRPFTDKQIELVKNFAAQAVIAIENTRLLNELRESLQQQTATADVLKVISRSTFNLQVVLDTLVESAAMLCQADKARILRPTGEDASYYVQARTREPSTPEYDEHIRTLSFAPGRGGVVSRVLLEGKSVHIPDVFADPEYTLHESARLAGYRTSLGVPLLREGSPIGILVLQRATVRPYTDKEIELAETFADQAVIAIENVRLFDEVQARTRELSESLKQQTATSEVLQIISSSQGDLEPVFNAMLENATRICEAKFGVLFLYEGDAFRVMALHGAPPAYAELRRRDPRIGIPQGTALARIVETRQTVQVADIQSEPAYSKDPQRRAGIIGIAGARTLIMVPMLKDGGLVGAISMYRQEVRPFTDKQIELVTNFASQAVIAIENARLLNELRQRTDDLSESLEQQTATSEVLQVISSSRGELEPVFDAMLANATRICEAKFGTLYLHDGDGFHAVAATRDAPPAYVEARRRELRIQPSRDGPLGCAAITKQVAHVADMMELQSYRDGSHPQIVEAVELGKFRTALGVPMLKDDELIGVITILRQEVRPFTEKQIELVQNFAAQAVIAIENTRLLNELRESLQQQTATADVLKVISRSAFDLRTVLQALVESAARFCNADKASVIRERDGGFYSSEAYGYSREFMDYVRNIPFKAERGTASGRAILEGRVIHIADVKADPEYTLVEGQRLGDYRTILCVPMLREGVPIGILVLTRSDVRPFTDKQIELVTSFADQAAIAIENVRLFESVEARTRELARSLEDLRNAQDRLVQTQKLASLGQLTAGIAHEIKNPLNFVNNFSEVSGELIDELQDTLKGPLNEKVRAEVNELTETLRGNLDKIVQHGRRADAIVKNMLLHSREGSSEHRLVDINALVEESLNLAYHGARAEKQGFNITLERSFDPAAEQADVFPQDITRVLLNLILNGFYAATKRKAEAEDGYEPTLTAATRSLGDRVEIKVRDNGTGIPPEVKEKIFNPFFTTKPAGEGTGLGLSISHDIIVKQHGGSIEVETEPGEYTEFRIILPRTAAFVTASGAQS